MFEDEAIFQTYRCDHPNCSLFFVRSDRMWRDLPYCPTRDRSEADQAHPLAYLGPVSWAQIQRHRLWLGEYVHYTCHEYDGEVCCTFVCEGTAEPVCPRCGTPLKDGAEQQIDRSRYLVPEPAPEIVEAEV